MRVPSVLPLLCALAPAAHALVIGGAPTARPRVASKPVMLDFLKQFMPQDRPVDADVTSTVYFDMTIGARNTAAHVEPPRDQIAP